MLNKCSCKPSLAYPDSPVDTLYEGKINLLPYICLISNPSYTFRDAMTSTKNDGSCSDDARLCPEQVQAEENNIQICVKAIQPCPVNSMIISNSNPSLVLYKKGPSFADDQRLYYSNRQVNRRPLAQFILSEDSVCYENNKTNISKGRVDSIFLKS
jgi:hypothetical protein